MECFLDCDLAKYCFYYLCIYVHFIKCNVSILCISEYPRDVIKYNISFLYIPEYSHELHDLHKNYHLHLNVSKEKKTYSVTINVTCFKMKDSANLHPSLF